MPTRCAIRRTMELWDDFHFFVARGKRRWRKSFPRCGILFVWTKLGLRSDVYFSAQWTFWAVKRDRTAVGHDQEVAIIAKIYAWACQWPEKAQSNSIMIAEKLTSSADSRECPTKQQRWHSRHASTSNNCVNRTETDKRAALSVGLSSRGDCYRVSTSE